MENKMSKRRVSLDDRLIPREIDYVYAIVAGPHVTWIEDQKEASDQGEGEEFRVCCEGPAVIVEAVDWYHTTYGQFKLCITNASPDEAVILAQLVVNKYDEMRQEDEAAA